MKITLKHLLVTLFSTLLLSCSSNQYDQSMYYAFKKKRTDIRVTPTFDNEVEPEAPDLKENNNTIIGIDSNKNGIRDDVEIWINRTANNFNERQAMRQYARNEYEYFLEVNNQVNGKKLTRDKEKLISQNMTDTDCIDLIFYNPELSLGSHISDKLDLLIRNTSLRKDASWSYFNNSSFSAGSKCSDDELSCCQFEIQNKEQLLKDNLKLVEKYRTNSSMVDAKNKKESEDNSLKKKMKYELMDKKRDDQKPLINLND